MVPAHLLVAATAAKSITQHFKEAGATEPGRAIAWGPPDKTQAYQFKRYVERGALVEMRPGTWYLNEEKLAALGGAQGMLVVLLVGLALLGAGMLFLLRAG